MELSRTAHQDTFTRDHLPPHELWPTLEFTLPELQYPERLNAATVLIDDTVETFGADRPALLAPDGTSLSYGELLTRANQVAQILTEDFGIVPGNRVMLRAPNNGWLVACWLGVIKAGAVVVTTMPALRAAEIEKLAALTKPSLMLCDHRFMDDALAASAGGYPVVPVGSDSEDDVVARAAAKSGQFTNVDTAADDVALLGPTSGTTGVPKITMHFHRDILANADTFARHILRPTADDVFAGSPPLAFTFGLGGLVVFPLRFGASSLLTERTTPVELAQLSHDAGATILFTAPTAYRAMLKEGKADLLRGLRVAVSAGEHLPAATWQAVKDATGLELIDGIGSTELLHVFISAAGEQIRPGTTGKAVPGYRATILDLDGNELGPDEVGRLAVIGPTGCRYLDDERQHAYVSNGWNVTGDTFVRDADGYFTYQARSDNMIISSGYNIGGPEVEEAIIQHPDVLETAVVARPDEHRGSVVCAFVVLVDGVSGSAAKAKELQDFVKTVIAPYKYPREVRFVDELPRNPSGKLQHFKLREALADAPAS
ncbi:AMP-binding protein [Paeniglutamicibacter kerguelensis]|uniref:2-aminobenzoate-CoA ligase n=1 Tax=Paeniglutamicibacter kerguelensis TaxID=254788 RepID=A0ABS4XG09_9MICC|nr:AMP-binding protein [Paeniglutamicibacter kerguelensis]MBP2387390.1 2-aminobenzoate-CoA ligase [Paeniglutamicibacter kerguelensis]